MSGDVKYTYMIIDASASRLKHACGIVKRNVKKLLIISNPNFSRMLRFLRMQMFIFLNHSFFFYQHELSLFLWNFVCNKIKKSNIEKYMWEKIFWTNWRIILSHKKISLEQQYFIHSETRILIIIITFLFIQTHFSPKFCNSMIFWSNIFFLWYNTYIQ